MAGLTWALTGCRAVVGWSRQARWCGDVWVIGRRCAVDASPPGDWTVQVQRDAARSVTGLTLGCWLARCIACRRCAPGVCTSQAITPDVRG